MTPRAPDKHNVVVYFDATFLQYGDRRGIYQVTMQLIALLATDPRFADVALIVTARARTLIRSRFTVPEARFVMVRPLPIIGGIERFHGLWVNWRYRHIRKNACLIIHPEFRTVVDTCIPQAVMFHDLIEFSRSTWAGRRKWSRYVYFLWKLRRAVRARYLWTNSEFTKRTLLERFRNVPPAAVTVLPLSSRSPVAGSSHPKELHEHEALQLLYVGSYEPRKNVAALLQSLACVVEGISATLHLAGRCPPEQRPLVDRALARARRTAQVVEHGPVLDEELQHLYAQCHFFLFPSLAEGFGMPILEAMSHGLVVCAFNNSSIPEVAGHAALLSADNDFGAWGRAIRLLCQDHAAYSSLSAASLSRAREFSEGAMFARYAQFIESIMNAAQGQGG